MKNLLLLSNYLIKFYDLLLNLFLLKQAQLPLPNLLRTLGLTLEEVGDIVGDVDAVVGEVLTVILVEDVDTPVVMVIIGEALTALMEILTVLMGILTVLTVTKDLPEVHKEDTVVLTVVVEEESGDITLRNLKNKRCELLQKLR
jgi:hypothetical protein